MIPICVPQLELWNEEKKYSSTKPLIESIKNGSKGKWKNFKLIMPPFKKMTDKDIEGMANWILELKNKDKTKG